MLAKTDDRVRYVPGELLVKFADGTPQEIRNAVLARAGAKSKRKIDKIGARVVEVSEERLPHALAALKSSPHVEHAEREVYLEKFDTTPNDPLWSKQWGPATVRAPRAWDVTRGSSSVVIAVLDTGVDFNHADLRAAFVPGYDVVNGDSDPSDDQGHGTAAAGVIAARTNNVEGMAGMCWVCSLMPVKVLDSSGSGSTSTVAAGMIWAVDHGARILSISLGGAGTTQTLTDAVAYATGKGAILVAAAGNSGTSTPSYPAAYPDVIAVTASTSSDSLYTWSNYGSWVQFAAPGCNAAPARAGGYVDFCGTSSATPVVAGTAGLALSLRPALSRAELEQAMSTSAAALSGVQYGRVNAERTVAALGGTPTAAPPVATEQPMIAGTARVAETLTAANGGWSGATPMSFGYQWLRCDGTGSACSEITGATAQSYILSPSDANATLRVRITASNAAGSAVATSEKTAVVLLPPPANVSLPAISGTARVGQTLSAAPGTWTYTPTRYAYQWRRCDTSGAACAGISGATARGYTLTSSDRGKTIRVLVSAANAGGASSAVSNPTAIVAASTVKATFKGTVSRSTPSRSYRRAIGAGRVAMSLSFTGARSLTLSIVNSKGARVARFSGPSPLRARRTLGAGTYRFVVRTSRAKAAFKLVLTYHAR